MPKAKPLKDKEKEVKEFVQLTWEVVRRNPEYRQDYSRFFQNYRSTPPEDGGPEGPPDRRILFKSQPVLKVEDHDPKFCYRLVREVEDPDPEHCNLAYMVQRWGFACDPDGPTPTTLSCWRWAKLLSLKKSPKIDEEGSIRMPLSATAWFEKLPGVLQVNSWPAVKIEAFISPPYLGWEAESPPLLTITINLQAPSWLIQSAIEILIPTCKMDIAIQEKQIEWTHIRKCLQAWDLKQEGYAEEQIVDLISPTQYSVREQREFETRTPEMIEGDHEIDRAERVYQVRDYIKKAEFLISQGSLLEF